MTKIDALNTAIAALSTDNANDETIEILQKMVAQLSKPRVISDEAKAKANAKRKEQTAQARNALMEKVVPVLREALTHTQIGVTAKELYDLAKDKLPEDFSAAKVQYILLHEMASEVVKEETKGKANTYRLAE